jgi:hypothetical protein
MNFFRTLIGISTALVSWLSVSSVAGLVCYKVGWLQFGLIVNGYKVNIPSLILTRDSITNTSSSSSSTIRLHTVLLFIPSFIHIG